MQTNPSSKYDIVIAGGGLASLFSGIILSNNGFKVRIFEKKKYPFHKVCGEYVSNEVLALLQSIGFDPFEFGASRITRLALSDTKGRTVRAQLDLGGFGLSRYTMDYQLAKLAKNQGVEITEGCRVNNISFDANEFLIESSEGNCSSNFVIGAYGKRDLLDKRSGRSFIEKHTGYMGVKYHVKADYPIDEIGLYHFRDGYCGISKVEGDTYNLCYLYRRNSNYKFSTINELQEKVLFGNPVLKEIFNQSSFISESPEVINEIYFDKKECVKDHILYCGDAAGLITPLCGNGMSMAIHGAVLLSSLLKSVLPGERINDIQRQSIETQFSQLWSNEFSRRLFWGRQLQKLSGKPVLTSLTIMMMKNSASIRKHVIGSTHGKPLQPLILKPGRQWHQTSHQ